MWHWEAAAAPRRGSEPPFPTTLPASSVLSVLWPNLLVTGCGGGVPPTIHILGMQRWCGQGCWGRGHVAPVVFRPGSSSQSPREFSRASDSSSSSWPMRPRTPAGRLGWPPDCVVCIGLVFPSHVALQGAPCSLCSPLKPAAAPVHPGVAHLFLNRGGLGVEARVRLW